MMMLAALLMTATNVNAQSDEPKHELGVSYGLGVSLIGDGIGTAIGNGLFDGITGHEWKDNKQFGTLGIEYFYHLNNPRLAVGGILTFAQYGEDVVKKNGGAVVGTRTRNYYSVMPAFKYYWVNKKKFGLYSKAAAGMMFLNYKDKDKELNKTLTDNDVLFMFQVSLIGAEIGSQNLRGFAELGGGEQGIVMFGVRAKF